MNILTSTKTDSKDAERIVIGLCFTRTNGARRVSELIHSADFGHEPCRKIYDALSNVRIKGVEVEPGTVDAACEKMFPGAGLSAEIIECVQSAVGAAAIDEYCRIVKEASQRRTVREIADNLIAQASAPEVDIEYTVDEARTRLANVIEVSSAWRSMGDILLDAFQYIEDVSSGKIVPCVSGLESLDRFTGGFFPKELTIIGARPSVGKTAFGLSAALSSAMQGRKVCFASAEMGSTQIGQRVFSDAANINGKKLRKPKGMSDEDWMALSNALTGWSEVPVQFLFERNIEEIARQIRKERDRGRCDMAVIDYVQLLTARKNFEADRLRVGYISAKLKALTMDLDMPIIALAQLTRPTTKEREMPRLESLKDSGSLEQDADNVILMHRVETRDDPELQEHERPVFDSCKDTANRVILFNIAKARQGDTRVASSVFDGAHMRFAPIERKGNG